MSGAVSWDQIAFWVLAVFSFAGAATVVFTRDVMRMTLGLGAFFLSVAGWFLYFGHAFLAAAQVFLYAGGVLVLVLFAIMLVHRSEHGAPSLTSRHALDSAVLAAGVGFLVVTSLQDAVPAAPPAGSGAPATPVAEVLLGSLLPHFEVVGVLLLVAIVAAIVIMGGERE